MEQSVLIEADLFLQVLVAEDAAALATMMAAHEKPERLLATRGGADDSGAIRLPVVPSDGTRDWRKRGVIVDGSHVFGRDARDGRGATRALHRSAGAPAGNGQVDTQVFLWWRSASRSFGPSQRCGDVIGCPQRSNRRGMLRILRRLARGGSWRGGRHVHGCVGARVHLAVQLCGLFVCVLERVGLRSDGRAGELRCHVRIAREGATRKSWEEFMSAGCRNMDKMGRAVESRGVV